MFDYLTGIIADKRKTSKGSFVTLDVVGVGYLLEVSQKDFDDLYINNDVKKKMFVSLIHREDMMSLYGFLSKETRDIFQILLSVSGVGAKMAIALLNEFDTCLLISLVIDGNYKELTLAKGVGPKLAQKIILELKDKLMKSELPKASCEVKHTQAIDDTNAVLLSLGYEQKEIEQTLAKIMPTLDDAYSSEELIRKALTSLSM